MPMIWLYSSANLKTIKSRDENTQVTISYAVYRNINIDINYNKDIIMKENMCSVMRLVTPALTLFSSASEN